MPQLPVAGSPLGPAHKTTLQRGSYMHTAAVAAADRMDRVGLDVTPYRVRMAQAMQLIEAILAEYFPGV